MIPLVSPNQSESDFTLFLSVPVGCCIAFAALLREIVIYFQNALQNHGIIYRNSVLIEEYNITHHNGLYYVHDRHHVLIMSIFGSLIRPNLVKLIRNNQIGMYSHFLSIKMRVIPLIITLFPLYQAQRLCDLSICANGDAKFSVDISHDEGTKWQPITSASTKVDITIATSITDIAFAALRFQVDDEDTTGGFAATVGLTCDDGYYRCFYTDDDDTMFDVNALGNQSDSNIINALDTQTSRSRTDALDCMHPDAKAKWLSNGLSGDTLIFKADLFGDVALASDAWCSGENEHTASSKSWLEPPKLYFLIGGVGCLLLIGVLSYFLWPRCWRKCQTKEITKCVCDSEHVIKVPVQCTRCHQSVEECYQCHQRLSQCDCDSKHVDGKATPSESSDEPSTTGSDSSSGTQRIINHIYELLSFLRNSNLQKKTSPKSRRSTFGVQSTPMSSMRSSIAQKEVPPSFYEAQSLSNPLSSMVSRRSSRETLRSRPSEMNAKEKNVVRDSVGDQQGLDVQAVRETMRARPSEFRRKIHDAWENLHNKESTIPPMEEPSGIRRGSNVSSTSQLSKSPKNSWEISPFDTHQLFDDLPQKKLSESSNFDNRDLECSCARINSMSHQNENNLVSHQIELPKQHCTECHQSKQQHTERHQYPSPYGWHEEQTRIVSPPPVVSHECTECQQRLPPFGYHEEQRREVPTAPVLQRRVEAPTEHHIPVTVQKERERAREKSTFNMDRITRNLLRDTKMPFVRNGGNQYVPRKGPAESLRCQSCNQPDGLGGQSEYRRSELGKRTTFKFSPIKSVFDGVLKEIHESDEARNRERSSEFKKSKNIMRDPKWLYEEPRDVLMDVIPRPVPNRWRLFVDSSTRRYPREQNKQKIVPPIKQRFDDTEYKKSSSLPLDNLATKDIMSEMNISSRKQRSKRYQESCGYDTLKGRAKVIKDLNIPSLESSDDATPPAKWYDA